MNSPAKHILAVAVLLCGCTTNKSHLDPASSGAALLKADREFAAYSQAHGVAAAFRSFAAENALSLPMDGLPIHGREGIAQSLTDVPAGALTWQPVAADIARSGDLGYTWGTYELRASDDGGKPVTRHGKYVTVWKKERAGSWKFVVDIGNASPPPG